MDRLGQECIIKSCIPYGRYILTVFFMRKIPEILVFFMINSMCSLCRIRYANFFVFVVDGLWSPFNSIKEPIYFIFATIGFM